MQHNNLSEQPIEISYIKNKYPKIFLFFRFIPGFTSIVLILIIFVGYIFFLLDKQVDFSGFVFLVAVLVLIYYIWWLIRGFEYITLVFIGIFNLIKYSKLDFNKILFKNTKFTKTELFYKKKIRNDKNSNDIIHWFILPTYKEDLDILIETIRELEISNYNNKKIALTIAGEQADETNFLNNCKILENIFIDKFGFFSYTVHPKGIEGEIPGKGANISYSAKQEYNKIVSIFNTDPSNILVTTLDADTNIDKEYINILTYSYLISENRKYKSYQPMIFFFNNFWETPFFGKIISLCNSFFLMFNAVKKYGMRNFSTHAQPLDALIETNFWSSQTVVEDGHQYWRSFFIFKGNYECIPIYTKVYQDANLNKSLLLTAKAQYNQMRRWAHGAEDISYVMCQWIDNFHKVSFIRTFYEFIRLYEGVILWGTLHIILMSGITFTLIRDIKIPPFFSLGWTISIFITLSFLILIFVISLSLLFSPWNKLKNKKTKIYEILKYVLFQIWFVGPTLLVFAGLPALHTQIALMIGKPMKKFNVTEKIRK